MTEKPKTDAQRRAIELLGRGLPVREVAEELGLAERTVRKHRERFAAEVERLLEPTVRRLRGAAPEALETLRSLARVRDSRGNPTAAAGRAAQVLLELEARHARSERAAKPAGGEVVYMQISDEQVARAIVAVREIERRMHGRAHLHADEIPELPGYPREPDPDADPWAGADLPDLPDA